MNAPSEQEVVRIAASVRLTGELLEANGSRAIMATAGWKRGPRSAPLEPSGSDRYEIVHANTPDEFSARVPSDAVGEAAITEDPHGNSHVRLLHLVKIVDQSCTELRKMLYAACPQATQPDAFDPDTPAQISAAGWCVSCHRDSGYCEPVSMRPDGTRRYRDWCDWCGRFAAANDGKRPPLKLVEMRHAGRRVTQRDVDAAMAEEKKPTPKSKKRRKKAA